MSDGTSVGKIQLDVEIIGKSLDNQIKSMAGNMQKAMDSTMGNFSKKMGSFFKSSTNKMANHFKDRLQQMSGGGKTSATDTAKMEEAKTAIERLSSQMDNASNQAEMYRQRLKELVATYESLSPASKNADFGRKVSAEMLKAEERMMRYSQRSDEARIKIEQLESSMSKLGSTGSKSGGLLSWAFEKMNSTIRKTGGLFNKAGKSVEKTTKRIQKSGKGITNFATTFQRAFARVIKQVLLYSLAYKAIRGLSSYMNAALKTNSQFVKSMNQIKTNLSVAFMPIYNFILPAINALMAALAKATAYIATFFSALSGKSYQQNYAAAKSLDAAKKSAEGYGKAAKGALMGFDEINQLQIQDEEGGGGTGGFEMTPPDLIPDMGEEVGFFKNIFADIFEPFQTAWQTQGQATIDRAKIALNEVKNFIYGIGKSFKEVWTGGIGQQILETMLSTLQNVFGLIGNIGKSFAEAWVEGDKGTGIIQGIFDIAQSLGDILESVAESAVKMWGEIGSDVSATVMNVLETTVDLLKELGEKLLWVWDNGGKTLFENIIRLGAKFLEVAGLIYTKFVAPVVMYLTEKIAPALAWVLDKVNWFVGKVIGGFERLYNILVGNSIIPDLVNAIVEWFTNLDKWVSEKVKALVVSVITSFNALWGAVVTILSNTWNSATTTATRIFNAIKNTISTALTSIRTNIDNFSKSFKATWDKIWTGAKTVFSNTWDSLTGIVKGVINGIIGIVNKFINFWNKIELKVPSINIPRVGEVGGFSIGVPKLANIPMLARGGIIDQPTLAMIGERGKEAVVPLENTAFVNTLASAVGSAVLESMRAFSYQGSNDGDLHLTVQFGSETLTEKVIRNMDRQGRISGKTRITV